MPTSPSRPASPPRRAALRALPLVLAVGCGSSGAEDGAGAGGAPGSSGASGATPCGLGFLGDPEGQPTVQIHALDHAMTQLLAVSEGGPIPLSTPPQGGRVIFTALRATNLTPCAVSAVATIRDPEGTESRTDARTVNLEPQGDGWGESVPDNLGTVVHLPVCPNLWSTRDLFDQPYEVSVTLTDPDGRVATQTLNVTPACSEGGALDDECRCICAAGYELGAPCF